MTKLEDVRLRRTEQSTILEIAGGLFTLFAWLVAGMAVIRHTAETKMFIAVGTLSLTTFLMFWSAYRPASPWIRNSYKPKTINQLLVTAKFFRIFAIETAMLNLGMAIGTTFNVLKTSDKVVAIGVAVIYIGTKIYMYIQYKKVKKADKATQKQKKT